MKKTTRKTFTLDASDVRRAFAEYVNLHSCGEDSVDEDRIELSFNHGTLDEPTKIPTVTVISGDS